MMQVLVYGPPGSMGSNWARVNPKTGRAMVMQHNSAKLRSFQSEVREAMRETKPAEPHLGAIEFGLIVFLKRPKGHFGTGKNASVLKSSAPKLPTGKPDLSKILRAVEDCGSGIWYRDDAQICRCRPFEKRYVGQGEEERVWIQARLLEEKTNGKD